jgi:hypothetical protein
VDFASFNAKVTITECRHAAEVLLNVLEFEEH